MSIRKKKNVQSAKEPKPEDAKPAEVLSETPSPEPTQAPTVKAVPISLEGVSADKIKMAEDLGIPVTQIVTWMGSVEERLKLIEETLPQKIQDSFKKVIMEAQAQLQAGPGGLGNTAGSSGNVGGGGGGLIEMARVAKEMGLIGGSSNPLMDKYVDALITRNMNEMVESTTFDKIMREYFIKKMSKELGEPLLSATPKSAGA